MTNSVRSKTTITFWLKKMVILLKSWWGNIDVKLFTTFVSEYFKIFLRNSWENLGNRSKEIPRNWFWRPFRYKFSLVFLKIGNKKFPRIGYKKFLGYSYVSLLGISWEFPRIFRKIITWVSGKTWAGTTITVISRSYSRPIKWLQNPAVADSILKMHGIKAAIGSPGSSFPYCKSMKLVT